MSHVMTSVNPFSGETIAQHPAHSDQDAFEIISACARQFCYWRKFDFRIRSELMNRAAVILREHKESFARLMALEMGKPIREGRGEIDKCAWVCEFYAQNAPVFLQNEEAPTELSQSFVSFQPLGVILAIMPWNFPFWQVFRFAAPALMAGNTAVLKHASNVPGCALAVEQVFREAGFPEHSFRAILAGSSQVPALIAHPAVRAVTLTGSTPAGKATAALAGSLLKKTVLELGGSDPYIILADANLETAVPLCVTARLINSGQSCIAAKRFIVVESIRTEFEARMTEKMRGAKMGDPLQEDSTIGPQARRDLRDELHAQVMKSIKMGARLLTGGEIPPGNGAFYPPTILTEVKKGMPAYDEELFGPVAAIISVPDEAAAIAAANDSCFGLGAALFTANTKRGLIIAEKEIEAGCCFVNTYVRSDPRLPFGGIRESGYGRELSHFGIREFVNIKTVCLQ